MQRHYFTKFLVFLLIVVPPSTTVAQNRVVLIGFSGPLSGMSESYGRSMMNAAQMAIDEANLKGNTIGKDAVTFELSAQDDKQDANLATAVARHFVRSGVVGVIGHTNIESSLATAKIYDEGNLANISPATSGRDFTKMGYRSSFRVIGHDERAIDDLVPFLLDDLGAARIGVISNQTIFGATISATFKRVVMERAGTISIHEVVSRRTFDFNVALDRIAQENVDVIFFGGGTEQAAMLAQSIKRKKMKARLVSAMTGMAGDSFLKVAGDAANGVLALEPGLPFQKMPGWGKFSGNYNIKYADNINLFTVFAYDATNVLIEAVKKANSTGRVKIVDALHAIRYGGASGTISFDRSGDLNSPAFTLYEVKNLKWTPVKIFETKAN